MNTHAQPAAKTANTPARTFARERPLTPARFGTLQRTCACGGGGGSCPECQKKNKKLQRWSTARTGEGATAPAIVHEVLGSQGQPLEPATRAFMEPRFGYDFSRVRVHTDTKAAESARAVNALAYTVGDHLVFDHSHYAPGTHEGRRLLAHELAHTIQQSREGLPGARFDTLSIGAADDVYEREADAYSETVTAGTGEIGSQAPYSSTPAGGALQRKCACGSSTGSHGECETCKKNKLAESRTPASPEPRPDRDFGGMHFRADARIAESGGTPLEWHVDLPGTVETAGEAHCDPNAGRMTWSTDPTKLPICMADCAKAHELSHVAFGQDSCAKVSAAAKAASDAIAKAKKSQSPDDLKDAEKKTADLEKAAAEYRQWFSTTCAENEKRAYQAGIDYCNKPDVVKSCDDMREKETYQKTMRDWMNFRDHPPNCSAPTPPQQGAPSSQPQQPPPSNPPQQPPSKLSSLPHSNQAAFNLVSRLGDGNAGETGCDVSVGTPSSTINSPSPCYEPCTRRHEAVHVRDLTPCCTKANKAYKAATTDDKKQAVQDKMNQWVTDNLNYLECNGYTESVRCADEFLTANCGAPKPQSSAESPSTDNQQNQMAGTDNGSDTQGTDSDSEQSLVSERLLQSVLSEDKPADAPIDPQRCCATVKDYRYHHGVRRDSLCAAKKSLTPCLF